MHFSKNGLFELGLTLALCGAIVKTVVFREQLCAPNINPVRLALSDTPFWNMEPLKYPENEISLDITWYFQNAGFHYGRVSMIVFQYIME